MTLAQYTIKMTLSMRRILSSNQNLINVKFEEKRSPNPCFASGNEWKSGDAKKPWPKEAGFDLLAAKRIFRVGGFIWIVLQTNISTCALSCWPLRGPNTGQCVELPRNSRGSSSRIDCGAHIIKHAYEPGPWGWRRSRLRDRRSIDLNSSHMTMTRAQAAHQTAPR